MTDKDLEDHIKKSISEAAGAAAVHPAVEHEKTVCKKGLKLADLKEQKGEIEHKMVSH